MYSANRLAKPLLSSLPSAPFAVVYDWKLLASRCTTLREDKRNRRNDMRDQRGETRQIERQRRGRVREARWDERIKDVAEKREYRKTEGYRLMGKHKQRERSIHTNGRCGDGAAETERQRNTYTDRDGESEGTNKHGDIAEG